jgi:hypothetical protein
MHPPAEMPRRKLLRNLALKLPTQTDGEIDFCETNPISNAREVEEPKSAEVEGPDPADEATGGFPPPIVDQRLRNSP